MFPSKTHTHTSVCLAGNEKLKIKSLKMGSTKAIYKRYVLPDSSHPSP